MADHLVECRLSLLRIRRRITKRFEPGSVLLLLKVQTEFAYRVHHFHHAEDVFFLLSDLRNHPFYPPSLGLWHRTW